ncbi:unnamed protein product [Linum trigynum]|uniref:DUF599 domain-containing protein n=1 Tax=Linum trigynum TaxID=586398 RepID=A0AAV2D298_9ROSI
MEKRVLDYTLVPLGLVMMVSYHLWLLCQILNHPSQTIVGINAINRRFWVRAMMDDPSRNGVLAVQTLRNNIMASTLLASTAIMLSSLIAMLMGSSTLDKSRLVLVLMGDASDEALSLKFFSILLCFLLAFLLTVQSIRYYSHASLLINVPLKDMKTGSSHLTVDYVARSVNRGGYFWSLGLRAFYFSLPLLLWLFGPVPMFLCCFVLVSMLYFLDVTLEDPGATSAGDGEDGGHVLMNHQDPDHCQLTTSQHRV